MSERRTYYTIIEDAIRDSISEAKNVEGMPHVVTGWLVIAEIAGPDDLGGLTVLRSRGTSPWSRLGWLQDVMDREKTYIAFGRQQFFDPGKEPDDKPPTPQGDDG